MVNTEVFSPPFSSLPPYAQVRRPAARARRGDVEHGHEAHEAQVLEVLVRVVDELAQVVGACGVGRRVLGMACGVWRVAGWFLDARREGRPPRNQGHCQGQSRTTPGTLRDSEPSLCCGSCAQRRGPLEQTCGHGPLEQLS